MTGDPLTYLTAQSHGILDPNTSFVSEDPFGLTPTSIPDGTSISYTTAAQSRRRSSHPCQKFRHQSGNICESLRDVNLERRNVPKMSPDSQAKVPERDGLVVLDKHSFPCGCLRGHQILCGQDMGICNVGHVSDIPQVETIADNKRGLPLLDTRMDGRDQLVVTGTTENGRSERTSRQRLAGCVENHGLCGSLPHCQQVSAIAWRNTE